MKKLFLLIFICVTVLFLKTYFLEFYSISSSSMEPTLLPNDFIVVNKFSTRKFINNYFQYTPIQTLYYSLNEIKLVKKGDLILFIPPLFIEGKKKLWVEPLVKRCIGLPGDSLRIKVNKYRLQDLAVFDYDDDFEAKLSESMDYQIYIPRKGDSILLSDTLDFKLVDLILSEGHVFQKELDSSILIDGKKISSYTVQKDYYFFIGDNILSSYDSRNFGFVSEENLLGKILCIALSFNSKYDVWYKRLNWSRVAIIPK